MLIINWKLAKEEKNKRKRETTLHAKAKRTDKNNTINSKRKFYDTVLDLIFRSGFVNKKLSF